MDVSHSLLAIGSPCQSNGGSLDVGENLLKSHFCLPTFYKLKKYEILHFCSFLNMF